MPTPRRLFLIAALLLTAATVHAQLTLPAIFSEAMVLQRQRDIPVWGWGTAGQTVTVRFGEQQVATTVAADGSWRLALKPEAASAVGRDLVVSSGDETTVLANVLVGDVWLCSGQSNMQWTVARSGNPEAEIAAADHPRIRLFSVPNTAATAPRDNCGGAWRICSPDTVPGFSAVGYYFGRHLQQALDVPIGLINASWGGTVAEAWTSGPALREHLPAFNARLDQLADEENPTKKSKSDYWHAKQAYEKAVKAMYDAEDDPEAARSRAAADLDDSDWPSMKLPGTWEANGLDALDGIVWFRKTITLPESWAGKDLILRPGPIDEVDISYVNGVKVGARGRSRTREVGFWHIPREYRVPGEAVKAGENIIAIRVSDMAGDGGLNGGPAAKMVVVLAEAPDAAGIPLAGDWRYQVEFQMPPKPHNLNDPNRPSVLYNGLIHPIIPYALTGVIWYQGESNSPRPEQYRTLLPTLIADWRTRWGQGDFPFLVVQLANFRKPQEAPTESKWAELREAQAMTAADDPQVGLAVAIDIGEAADIHPKNKQEVGRRLGLVAEAIAYERDIVHSGPVFAGMTVADGRAVLRFTQIADGLTLRGDGRSGFTIAGADGVYHWADAAVVGDTVVVSSPAVAAPTAVRYAWADNPPAALYNSAGLPAVPFRTDAPTD